MQVDPMMQLNQAITSAFEGIAYVSVAVLAVMILVIAVGELRLKIRQPKAGHRRPSHDRDRHRSSNRVAPAPR